MRKQELDLLVRHTREAAYSGVAVDLSSMVTSFSTDVTCRMIIGKKYDREDFGEKGFEATVRETMRIASAFNLADYIPQIRGLDLQGQTKRMKAIAKDFDDFFEKILEEHVESKDENRTKDFIDVMLGFVGSEETEYRVERDTIKAIILDMLGASMDTSAATIDWTLVELIRHPRLGRSGIETWTERRCNRRCSIIGALGFRQRNHNSVDVFGYFHLFSIDNNRYSSNWPQVRINRPIQIVTFDLQLSIRLHLSIPTNCFTEASNFGNIKPLSSN
ncbi:hypothetical protein V6N13_026181 [Hibiscus sabdariffa]